MTILVFTDQYWKILVFTEQYWSILDDVYQYLNALKKIVNHSAVPILNNIWIYSSQCSAIFETILVSIGQYLIILYNIDHYHHI